MTEASRSALVTGVSRGIGAAVAEHLTRDVIVVVVNFYSNPASAEALADKIMQAGERAIVVQAEVS